jgi:hypothetical protein
MRIVLQKKDGKYKCKSGKSIYLRASLIGWTPPGGKKKSSRPPLFYVILQGDGDIDKDGKFTAPETKVNMAVIIEIRCTDPTVQPVEVIIEVEGVPSSIKIFPREAVVWSGDEVQFTAESTTGKNISPTYSLERIGHGFGRVDCIGKYSAPDIIRTADDKPVILILAVTDRYTGDTDRARIVLVPVKMAIREQQKISAGKETQLNIFSENDRAGLKNFSCRIISRPIVGHVDSGGMYYPPPRIDKPQNVTVEATSNLDPYKKVKLSFTLDYSICGKEDPDGNKCLGHILANGFCNTCYRPVTFGAYLAKKQKEEKARC